MNWKLIAAVIVGLLTAGLLYLWTENVKNEQTAYAFMRLQPDRKVARGETITPEMLGEPILLPSGFGTLQNLAVPAAGAYDEWLKARTAATDIPAGSVLLFQYFDDNNGGRLTSMIAPGKRALTLPVDAAEAVGHFVEPGSRVDIIGTVDEPVKPAEPTVATAQPGAAQPSASQTAGQTLPGQPAQPGQPTPPAPLPTPVEQLLKDYVAQYPGGVSPDDLEVYQKQSEDFRLGIGSRTRVVTRTFLQNVKVLAVGAATSPEGAVTTADTYSHVTVEVTPAEAEMLIFAMGQANGRLNLVLRNPADDTVEELPSINWTRM